MLHMEIIQERIEREFGIELIATAPSVIYKCEMNDGSEVTVDNPSQMLNVIELKRFMNHM